MRNNLCMVTCWAFDGDAAFSLLFHRPFTFRHTCFSIAAVVLRMFCKICVCMLDYEYLCVFAMTNDWGFFFFGWWIFATWFKTNLEIFEIFLKFLKILYFTNFDFEKTEFVSQTFDITKIETKKKTLLKTVTIIRCRWCNARHKRLANIGSNYAN